MNAKKSVAYKNTKMSPATRDIYIELCNCTMYLKRTPTMQELGRWINKGKTTIHYHLHLLADMGLLLRDKPEGSKTVFSITGIDFLLPAPYYDLVRNQQEGKEDE